MVMVASALTGVSTDHIDLTGEGGQVGLLPVDTFDERTAGVGDKPARQDTDRLLDHVRRREATADRMPWPMGVPGDHPSRDRSLEMSGRYSIGSPGR